MALRCPDCGRPVRGEAVEVAADAATCPHCGAAFQPSLVLPARGGGEEREAPEGGGAPEPPSPEAVYVERAPGGGLNALLPRRGIHGRAVFFFLFSIFWNLVTLVVSLPFLFAVFQGEMPWPLVFFLAIFWAVGIGTMLWACWLAWGETGLRLGPEGLFLYRKLFGRGRTRSVPLAEVEGFDRVVAYTQNDEPVYACALKAGGKKILFAHKLSDADQQWLAAELNQALERLRRKA